MPDGGEEKEEPLVLASLERYQRERKNHDEDGLFVDVPAKEEEGETAEHQDAHESHRRRITAPQIEKRRRQGHDDEEKRRRWRNGHQDGVRIFSHQSTAHRRLLGRYIKA